MLATVKTMRTLSLLFVYPFLISFLVFSPEAGAFDQVSLTAQEKAFLHSHPVITLGTDKNWEPYVIVKKDGTITGFDAEILAKINALSGANFQLKAGVWREMQKEAQERLIDGLSTGAIHEERKKFLNFSSIYISLQKMLLVAKGNPHSIHTRTDLVGKRIAIHRGNLVDEKLARKFVESEIIAMDTVEEIIRSVINGTVDATFGNGATLFLAQKLGLPYLEVNMDLQSPLQLAFGVRNDWPEAISILNKSLAAIPKHERLLIQKKWFGDTAQTPSNNRQPFVLTREEKQYLQEKKTVTMCVDPDWMPFEKIDANGQHVGMAADILALVQRRSGVKLETVLTKNWSESLEFAQARKCDIFSLAMETPERKKYMDFTEPYLSFPFVIATRTEELFIEQLENVIDRPLAIVKGYAYVEILRNRHPTITLIEVSNLLEGLNMVQNGKVYGFIGTLATTAYTLQTEGMVDVKIAGKFDDRWQLAIGTRNDEPILNSIMQKALQTVSEKEKRDIYNSWFSIRFEQGIDYSLVWKILGVVLIVATFAIFYLRSIKKYAQRLNEANALLEQRNIDLKKSLDEVTALRGILPICSFCKKIRDDSGYWEQVDIYIHKHSAADISHSVCPDCMKLHYPQEHNEISA